MNDKPTKLDLNRIDHAYREHVAQYNDLLKSKNIDGIEFKLFEIRGDYFSDNRVKGYDLITFDGGDIIDSIKLPNSNFLSFFSKDPEGVIIERGIKKIDNSFTKYISLAYGDTFEFN